MAEFEKRVLESGRYTVKIDKANASMTYGPSIGLFVEVLEGPAQVGTKTWFNLSSGTPKAKEIMGERLTDLGLDPEARSLIFKAIPDKEQAYTALANRLVGLVLVTDVTKSIGKLKGKEYNTFKVVELVSSETGADEDEETPEADVLDSLDV